MNGGSRGDGYMDSYSALLAHAPWAPGWGNHEYLEADRGNRLANITAGLIKAKLGSPDHGQHHHRMHYSVDIGLLHLLHLDLSPYWCRFKGCTSVDSCGMPDEFVVDASSSDPETRFDFARYREQILKFTEADLAAVNRSRTPWVVATAHYPMYETIDNFHLANLAHWHSEPDFGARGQGDAGGKGGVAPQLSKQQAIADFEDLLAEHGVDIFFAGHNHNYESTWPVRGGKVQQQSYTNPTAPIHILSGAAGPPEFDFFLNVDKRHNASLGS